jgi:hypothetical protein
VELISSLETDLQERRVFAYLSRLRQTEELYYRALYVLFIAKPQEVPHVFSGALPNGFRAIYRAVNSHIFEGRGELETPQPGLSGGEFTALQMLNDSAHASFPFFLTCISVVRDPEYQKDFDKILTHLKIRCSYLNYMEQAFAAGRRKEDVMVGVKNIHKPASAWVQKSTEPYGAGNTPG